MRKAFVISAIIGMMAAGAATAALAKTGDQYTLFAGGCLPGDTVNPAGSSFHCTEALMAGPGSGVANKTATILANKTGTVQQAPLKANPATKAPMPTGPGK